MKFRKTATIAAHEVMVGDFLYNSAAPHPALTAVRVTSVTQKADEVIIDTRAWTTYKHPREGMAIMRVPHLGDAEDSAMPAREVLRAWAMPCARGTTTYETVFYTDGSKSCDGPGWVYYKKGGERTCKHIRQLAREIAATLANPTAPWAWESPAVAARLPTAPAQRAGVSAPPQGARSGQRPRRALRLTEEEA